MSEPNTAVEEAKAKGLPLAQLDFVYARGMKPAAVHIPRGRIWWRMSDHLPLIADFKL